LDDGDSALGVAVQYGTLDGVRALLDAGADPDGRAGGRSALEIARDRGYADIAAVLVAAGAAE
ncbi:MAG TPA: ankyrin repeat domain-containing protein, partial [Rubricoccaceae bacterium]